ncbi:RNA helicase [Aphelenchoides fujianensis]|nr:RNA helicase [Aphelenchoides fujianensis]
MQSIPVLLQKRNLLATAPTGSGKTLAFLLPIVKLFAEKKRKKAGGLFAIVVAPTNVLASQIHVQALKFCDGMRAEVGLLEAGTECNPNANILVCTPNRLIYAMKEGQMTEQMLSTVEWLVVDEADRLFDKTEKDRNFRIQLEEIYRECHGAEKKVACRSAFFSATFSHELELWAREVIKDLAMVCIGPRNSSNSNVTQSLVYSGDESGKVLALVDLLHTGFEPPAIVFVQSKERAGALLVELQDRCPKIPIRLMSSELSAEAREKILTDFRTGKVWCLIATEMLARGLDLSVNLVVNFDVPTSIVSYVHRIGRTGRAGRSGRSITFFSFGDLAVIRPIATVIHQAGFEVPQYTLQLSKVNKDQHAWLKTQQPNREAIGSIGRWRRVKKAAMKSGAIKRDPKLLGKKKRKAKKAAEAPEIQEKPKEKKTKPKKKSKAKADE